MMFSEHTEPEIEELSKRFSRCRVSEGTNLTVEGASGYSFFVVEKAP